MTNFKTLLMCGVMLSTVTMARADGYIIYEPDLVQAATAFITGAELPPATRASKDKPDEMIQVNALMSAPNFIDPQFDRSNYFVAGHDTCIVYQQERFPPHRYRTWDFNKMPGQKSVFMKFGLQMPIGDAVTQAENPGPFNHLGTDAVQDPIVPASLKKVTGSINLVNEVRQLAALQYIRDHFCPGLPEAPTVLSPF